MTFYSNAIGSGLPADILAFLNGIKANVPGNVTFTVPSGGDLIRDTDGELVGSWTTTGGGTVVGTGVGGFAIGVGARIKWTTSGVVNGRRVRGSTYLVPLMAGSFETDGRVRAATITSLSTPLSALVTAQSGKLVIWSRPVGTRVGSSHVVTAGTIPSNPSTLRSRRT